MTWLDAAPYLGGAAVLGGLVVYVFFLRWKLAKAEDGEHVWKTKALQTVKDMVDLVAAANSRDARRTGVISAVRSQLDVATASAADAALADPAAADRFVRSSLREAAAATDAVGHVDLPRPTAAPAPVGGDRGGNR